MQAFFILEIEIFLQPFLKITKITNISNTLVHYYVKCGREKNAEFIKVRER